MKVFLCLFGVIFLMACNSKKMPDVSGVKVDLTVQRFEQDFFAIDTSNVDTALQQLYIKYPGFLQDFVFNILALPQQPDSNIAVQQNVISFIQSYRSLKDSADLIFRNFNKEASEIKKGLQYVKYYFPEYKLPTRLLTFIGPVNSYGNILTSDAIAVGLQLYMGKNYSLYQTQAGQELYPTYISRRFSREYIAVNSLKTIADDIFPDNNVARPLVEQMVQAGKRLYLLDRLLPETADTIKTGYTQEQLDGCYKNESAIYSYFVQNDLLYTTDPSMIRDYMNDAPLTQAFGPESPGFIGQFVGWQIVKKWMDKQKEISLKQLLEKEPRLIFIEAKYKP